MTRSDRYSRVARRMWADAKFRSLSAPDPNGQTLWLRMLTAPEQTAIPGVIVAWEAGLAQALGWPLKGFREAFGEAFAKGMLEAHWEAGLVWVPKAIEHNRPESPNVIRSWRSAWTEVPECELKNRIHSHLYGFVEGLGEGFRKAFRQALGEAFAKGSAGPSPNTRARLLFSSPDLDPDLDLPSGSVVAKDLTGSAREVPKPKREKQKPVAMEPGWRPPPDAWEAAKKSWEATDAQLERVTLDVARYWSTGEGQGVKRGPKGWVTTWLNRIKTLAKNGDLYAEPLRGGARPNPRALHPTNDPDAPDPWALTGTGGEDATPF